MKEVTWGDQIKSTIEIVHKARRDINKILKELRGYSPDTYQFEELAGRVTESLHQLDKSLLSLENISKDLFNRKPFVNFLLYFKYIKFKEFIFSY